MTLFRFTGLFAVIGCIIPLVFRLLWYFLNQTTYGWLHQTAQKLMLLLWPTSLMTLPSSDEPGFEVKLFLISVTANVVLYIVFGILIWLGLRKHISFLGIVSVLVFALWWRLLTL